MHVSQQNTAWNTPFLELISQKGAMMLPLTQVEVRLYYNKSHTFEDLANTMSAATSFQCCYIYTKTKKEKGSAPRGMDIRNNSRRATLPEVLSLITASHEKRYPCATSSSFALF
jgi:hypothetical protein